ncbi:MAG TPA: TonB-dependent receptor [Nitrospirota bacterium]|nr:TonB-dependent receptor [Nitrospirota bacterium]
MQDKRHFAQQVKKTKFVRTLFNCIAASIMAASTVLLSPGDARACASCGCTLNSDWQNEQLSCTPGLKMDLRWDFIDQDQLRSGTKTIDPATASKLPDPQTGGTEEIEKYTVNNYYTLGIDYSTGRDWGVNVQVLWINRNHSTLGTESDGYTPGPGGGQYNSHTSSLGDIKVMGRYQGLTQRHNVGVLFGLKLPTGSYTDTGTSTDPTAPGPVPIDRGLQPGTGTTDVIVGAYYTDGLSQNVNYFAQALYQKALDSRDQYKPGEGLNLTVGLLYAGFLNFSPLVQLNYRYVVHDEGDNADQVNTGGTLLYISPGITASISPQVAVYGFVQVPVYQDLNGVQLAPRYTASLGVRYSF